MYLKVIILLWETTVFTRLATQLDLETSKHEAATWLSALFYKKSKKLQSEIWKKVSIYLKLGNVNFHIVSVLFFLNILKSRTRTNHSVGYA